MAILLTDSLHLQLLDNTLFNEEKERWKVKYIPINALLARSRVKNSSIGHKINGGVYPLLTSYKEDVN